MVEDDDGVRGVLKRVLELECYKVLETEDGDAAIAVALREHVTSSGVVLATVLSPWVVLHLPVLDAKTVTNEISALKRLKVAGFHFVLVANHFSMSGVGLT